jgi:hypothetical protein
MARQVELAASHQSDTCARQHDGAVAQVMRLPRASGRDAGRAEKPLRDSAIPLAGQPAIEGAERQNQPPTSLYRQVRRGSLLRLAPRKPPEAERGIGSDREITIKRNERCPFESRLRSSRPAPR